MAWALVLLAAAIGALAVSGWLAGERRLLIAPSGSFAIKPDSALAVLLIAASLAANLARPRWRRARAAGRLAGAAAALLLLAVGAEWLLGVDLGVDTLVARGGAGLAPRIPPAPCAALLVLALGIELDRRQRADGRIVNLVALAPALYGLFALVGYLSRMSAFIAEDGVLRVSLPSSVALCAGGLALLLTHPERGSTRVLVSTGPGGLVARRLLPITFLLPLVLDAVRMEATRQGLLGERAGNWLYAFFLVLLFAAIVVRLARRLDLADIGRQQAEERLRASEERARSVTQSAGDGIVSADEHGAITLFNPAAERLFGWRATEVVGRPLTVLMPERYRAAHEAGLRRVAGGAAARLLGAPTELHGLRRDGTEFPLELSIAQVRHGDRLQVTAILRDVSERRAEAERITAVLAAQTDIASGAHDPGATMSLVAASAARITGADGAVVEMPEGTDLVYRAVVGTAGAQRGTRVPIAGSLAGSALLGRTTLSCTDAEHDPRVNAEMCRRLGIRSMVCVPLFHGDEAVGVLKVTSARPAVFDARDEGALELLAGIAASTLHRARAEQRLAAHHAVGEALAAAGSLRAGIEDALRCIGDELGWELGAVWLGDDAAPAATWRPAGVEAPLPAEAPAARAAWEEHDGPVRTRVTVPIALDGETLGVLALGTVRRYVEEAAAMRLLTALATQVGQFVQRRRAEQLIGEQADRLEAVARLSGELAAASDPRAVRPALCDGLLDLAGADQVMLLEPDGAGRLVVTGQAGGLVAADLAVDLTDQGASTAEVFRSGRGCFAADLRDGSRPVHEAVTAARLRSAHLEPLVRDGRTVGVLVVASRQAHSASIGGLGPLMTLVAAEAASTFRIADALLELEQRARTDQLTGVANRRAWDEELPKELARAARAGAPVSVALLDLDHFKRFNDANGHQAGDRLLRAAASGWADRLRATDVLARYGGEEFAVVLPGCEAASAERVADELRQALPAGSTCSIGVACWDGEESAEALVARADAALYRAKGGGRDRVVTA